MSEFTKGEWKVERDESNEATGIETTNVKICSFTSFIPTPPKEEQEANACLIAAAKDLLKACKEANSEIIAAIEIPTDKRLEKDKDNLIYVIRDMRAREDRAQQILKAAIAAAEQTQNPSS